MLSITTEIRTLHQSLRAVDRSLGRLAAKLSTSTALDGVHKENDRARPRLTAKARASLVLQGRYMGYMRQLKPRQKAQGQERPGGSREPPRTRQGET